MQGEEFISVKYDYPDAARHENRTLVGMALVVAVHSKTGKAVSALVGPDYLGMVYDKELYKCLSTAGNPEKTN